MSGTRLRGIAAETLARYLVNARAPEVVVLIMITTSNTDCLSVHPAPTIVDLTSDCTTKVVEATGTQQVAMTRQYVHND